LCIWWVGIAAIPRLPAALLQAATDRTYRRRAGRPAALRLMVLKEFVERPLIMSAVSRPARAQTSRLLSTYHLAGRRPGPGLDVSRRRRPPLGPLRSVGCTARGRVEILDDVQLR